MDEKVPKTQKFVKLHAMKHQIHVANTISAQSIVHNLDFDMAKQMAKINPLFLTRDLKEPSCLLGNAQLYACGQITEP
jgi:hypothetical protein